MIANYQDAPPTPSSNSWSLPSPSADFEHQGLLLNTHYPDLQSPTFKRQSFKFTWDESNKHDRLLSPDISSIMSKPNFFKSWGLGRLAFLLPSFMHETTTLSRDVSSTAFLDGLRGIAAFIVYMRHFASATHPRIQAGYGSTPEDTYWIQLPFFHILCSGPAMVSVFFIVSGYALSWSPLRAAAALSLPFSTRSGADNALTKLSSAMFRRAMRLFLPGVISTFIICLCVFFGLYDRGHKAYNSVDMPGFREPQPPHVPSYNQAPYADLWTQFASWWRETKGFVNVWSPSGTSYDPHLWTLGTEYKYSMFLFAVLASVARASMGRRLLFLGGSVLFCHFWNSWDGWLFFAGAFLAQWRIMGGATSAPPTPTRDEESLLSATQDGNLEKMPMSTGISHLSLRERLRHGSTASMARMIIFIAGLYLLSSPDYGWSDKAPGYMTLHNWTPSWWTEPWRFIHNMGGLFVVFAVSSPSATNLRRIFSNKFSVYLGRISYALYLVHGPVIHMLGFWLVPACWRWLGWRKPQGEREGGGLGDYSAFSRRQSDLEVNPSYALQNDGDVFDAKKAALDHEFRLTEAGFGIAFVIVTIVTVWSADLFTRLVDDRCVRLAKWVEGKFVQNKE